MDSNKINYNEQMLNYYPEVIKAIREFQVLIETQSLQVEEMHELLINLLGDAYVDTAGESRITEWEQLLEIVPLPQGSDDLETWLTDRRETIMARLYGTQKLNSKSISDIVQIFTGGSAYSYFKDGIIHIKISPPKNNKQYKFDNVEQELRKKIPAHLMFEVSRNYYSWLEIKNNHSTWSDVKNDFATWEDVLLCVNYGGGDEPVIPDEPTKVTFTIDGNQWGPFDYGTTWSDFATKYSYDADYGDIYGVVNNYIYSVPYMDYNFEYCYVRDANGNDVLANSVIESGDYYCTTQPQGDTVTFTLYDAESIDELDNPETVYKSGDYTVDYGTTWNEFAATTYDEENLGDYWMYEGNPITHGVSGKILNDSDGNAINGTSVIVEGNYYFVW